MALLKRLNEFKELFEGERLSAVLMRGVSGSFLVKVAGAGLGFASQVVLARILGSEQYGRYTYVWTSVLMLALVCTLGFRNVLTRFVASLRANAELARLRGLMRRSMQIVLGASVTVGLLGAGGSYGYNIARGSETAIVFIVGFALLPLIALTYLRQGGLRGLKCVVLAGIPFQVIRHAVVIGLVVLGWIIWERVSAVQAMGFTFFALAAAFGFGTYWLYRYLPEEMWEYGPQYRGKRWVKVAFPYLLISGVALVQSNVDIVMTGALVNPEAAGIYKVAAQVTSLLGFGLSAANMIVAPITAELYSQGDHERLQRLIGWTAAGGFVFTTIGGLLMVFVGPFLLDLFGAAFQEGYTAMAVLIVGKVVFTFAGPTGMLMTMSGQEWVASKAFGIGALLNVVANLILLPLIGIVGAAVATVISTTAWNSILAWIAIRRLDINPTVAFFPLQYLRRE